MVRSLGFKSGSWASRKRSLPMASSTRWRHAAILGLPSKTSQPAPKGCSEKVGQQVNGVASSHFQDPLKNSCLLQLVQPITCWSMLTSLRASTAGTV